MALKQSMVPILEETWDEARNEVETVIGSLKGVKVRVDNQENFNAKHMISLYTRPFLEALLKGYIKSVNLSIHRYRKPWR